MGWVFLMKFGPAVLGGILVVSAVMGGCLSDAGGSRDAAARRGGIRSAAGVDDLIPTDWYEQALPQGADHNHRDIKQHQNLSTANFEILGYEPLITDYYGKTAGDYFCGDVKEKEGRRLSVVHSWGSDVAFVLADVTDPRNPQKVGELVMANTQVYDVALTPDFDYVVLSTSPFDSGPDSPGSQDDDSAAVSWRDACTREEEPMAGPEAGLPYSSGVVLVDISNVRNPTVVDFRQLPVIGSHSVQVSAVKGQTFVTVSVDNAVSTASYYVFFEIRSTPAGGKLLPLSIYSYLPENANRANPYVGIHMDGVVALHPPTGKRLAYLAYRQVGLVMVDMDNPASPVFLSRWQPFPVGIHSVVPLPETWDGRHYTILGEECGGPSRGNPSCLIYVVDTTNPREPALVGAWTLPIRVEWRQGLQFSMHYYAVANRTLFVTTYHGGLWAIDLSTPQALETMPSIGVFLPDRESPKPVGRPIRSVAGQALFTAVGTNIDDRPTLLDVVAMSDGVLVTWDAHGGLYTVRFEASNPASPPVPWTIQGIGRN